MRFLLIQLTIYFLLNALQKFFIGRLFVLRKQSYIKDPVGNPNHSYFTFCISFCPAVIIAPLGKQSSPKEQL